jgi:hypothetical protein
MFLYFLSWFVCIGGYKLEDGMDVSLTPKVVPNNLLNIVNNIVADGSSYYGDDLTESQAT